MKKFFFIIFIFPLVIFSQQKVKVYKINDLVKRTSNSDTIYVINFWATWCKPCVAELPVFESLNTDSAKTNIKVLLVSMDFKEDTDKKLLPFLDKNRMLTEVIVLDETDATSFIPKLDDRWSGAIPATLIKFRGKKSFAEKKLSSEALINLIKEVR
jgi:thiol-disulfide isomerase/thioredoxin